MKTSLITILQIMFAYSLFAQSFVTTDGKKHLWGIVTTDHFKEEPFQDWFTKNQNDYTSTLTKNDGKYLKNIKVKAFLGTWCWDTKYLLPKLAKAWEAMGLDQDQIEYIALHRDGEKYKQGPNKETDNYNIHKVPTFVFEKNGEEIGRIVERVVYDLDTDLKLITQNKPYKNHYQSISILDEYLKTVEHDSLLTKTTINTAYRKIARNLSNASVINNYGYMLKYQGKTEKAKMVFKLNTYLFPYEPNTHDSYGEILLETNELEKAKEQYYEALRLKKEDEHIIKKLAEISARIADIDS